MLTGHEILKELGKNIIIKPFNAAQLNPNSYNLRLDNKLLVYDMADGCLDMKRDNPTKEIIIPEDGLILYPGKLYLGSTVEYTETHNYVPCIDGRSSIGRLGLLCHYTAGFGDVGVCTKWTLEISVIQPLRIYPYIEICQIYYQPVEGEITPYKGKYQNQQGPVASKMFVDLDKLTNNTSVASAKCDSYIWEDNYNIRIYTDPSTPISSVVKGIIEFHNDTICRSFTFMAAQHQRYDDCNINIDIIGIEPDNTCELFIKISINDHTYQSIKTDIASIDSDFEKALKIFAIGIDQLN